MSVRLTSLGVLALAAVACTQVAPEDLVIPTSSSSTTIVAASDEPDSLEGLLSGSIAIGGGGSTAIVDPDGALAVAVSGGSFLRQPTWSRDGRRMVAIDNGSPGLGQVSVFTVADGSRESSDASRGYFFFSWSDDEDHIAALGPGPSGTTLDVLDADGRTRDGQSLDAGSFYLAWEPEGDDLLVHRDRILELVRDPTDLATREPLGSPGQSFLAPAWIPGTRHALIVVDGASGGRLVRLDVDTGAEVDLGAVGGSAGIVVSPDGSRALLAHGIASAGGDIDIGFAADSQPVQDVVAPTELVDTVTGERTTVSEAPTFWAEWSPDGSKLALLQAASAGGVEWLIWQDGSLNSTGNFFPAPIFFRDYIFFAWQFVESPRIWSPGSDALVYAGLDDDGVSAIFVRRIDADTAVRVGDGEVAFWSP